MLDTLEVAEHYQDQLFYFLLYFVDLMKLDRAKLLQYFKQKGVDTKMVEKRLKMLNRVVSDSPRRNKAHMFPNI